MRQGQNSKRSRGRGAGRRNVPSRHQTFDSNGPSVRIRGSANQVHEKYLALARDAGSAGDRIAAENYFQHAEHYFRIINMDNDGDGRGRGQPNGGGRAGAEQGNGMDQDVGEEMTEAEVEVPGAAAADVAAVQPNGSGEQPDVGDAQPLDSSAAEAEEPPKRRASRGGGRTRGPRAAADSRKKDRGEAPEGGETSPPAEE